MKLVVNMIMGSFMVASAEGLALAKGVGLSEDDLIEVVNMAAIATPMFKLKVRSPGRQLACSWLDSSVQKSRDPSRGASRQGCHYYNAVCLMLFSPGNLCVPRSVKTPSKIGATRAADEVSYVKLL